jgi:hypothetical protein
MENQKKQTVVQKVLAILGLNDEGRVKAFFNKQVSNLEKSIKVLQRNLENFKFNAENKMNDLREQHEDAVNALEAAYLDVTIEDIKTNADADSFSEYYWRRVDAAEKKVQEVEKQIEELSKHIEEEEKKTNDGIVILQERIKAIS